MDTFCNRKRKKRKELERKKRSERLIKDRKIRDIRRLFEQVEEDYYKPKRVNNFWNNNYIEYDSNEDKNGMLSLDRYINKIEPYLRNIIIDLQSSYTWKTQLTMQLTLFLQKLLKKSVHCTHVVTI